MTTKEKIQYLLDNGFTYNQIGKICECHGTSISKWINGVSNISKRMEDSINNHMKQFFQKIYLLWSDLNE